VIIITGSGRSGTSFIASLYKNLGFDPGGLWAPSLSGGWEDPEVVQINNDVLGSLGGSRTFNPNFSVLGKMAPLWLKVRRQLPDPVVGILRTIWLRLWVRLFVGAFTPIKWGKVTEIASTYGDLLKRISQAKSVVKDPNFCYTLPVWAEAGASIDKVVVAFRDPHKTILSFQMYGYPVTKGSLDDKLNGILYGWGVLFATLEQYSIPYSVVRFPQMLSEPETLYHSLTFPSYIDRETFLKVFRDTYKPEMMRVK